MYRKKSSASRAFIIRDNTVCGGTGCLMVRAWGGAKHLDLHLKQVVVMIQLFFCQGICCVGADLSKFYCNP